jgi:hypothetical protein
MASAAEKLRDKLKKLHALLGSSNANEREAARAKIDQLLAKNKKNWNDWTELLFTGNVQGWQDDEPTVDHSEADVARPAPLDLIRHILQRHLYLDEHQFVAVTLWIAHTFLYSRFAHTPRLALLSPVRGCGKTTVLSMKSVAQTKEAEAMREDEAFPSTFLRTADVKDRPRNAVISHVALETVGQGADAKTKPVLFLEDDRPLVLNRTNWETLADAFGPDSDDWEGCEIRLYAAKTRYAGKPIDGIRVEAVKKNGGAA